MFENYNIFSTKIAGRNFVVETGKLCGLSNASCLVKYGDTSVLVNVTASQSPREGIDFFPLSVDFEEKLYSVGKIPGSFLKREGRPSEKAILASRLIDRPIRPLFPSDMRNDVSVVITVMSVDSDNSPEIAGMIGASIALSISDIPFNGPIGGVNIGLVDGEVVFNPDFKQREISQLDLTLAATYDKVVMIEAGANEIDEDTMLKAIELGHNHIREIIDFINGIVEKIGKPKFSFEKEHLNQDLYKLIYDKYLDSIKISLDSDDKNYRNEKITLVKDNIKKDIEQGLYGEEVLDFEVDQILYKIQKSIVRNWLLEGKRVDKRAFDEMRPLSSEISLIPRVHGSGLFTRGQTQVLSITTLGSIAEAQILDGITDDESKRYMHHYNFPSYSVGETRPSRGPGRREIGHGALAERALLPVIPSEEDFPYSIRVVSEVLSSNGSTSQASICGSTLSLMDAGVPIKAPVAGISCGLICEEDRHKIILDIQGLEDFFGDMDFKVAGTHKGITAIQVDIKIDGLSMDIIKEAFLSTKDARIHILDNVMLPVINKPREFVSQYAPKVVTLKINTDKIRDVIGSGGKVVQKICADFDVKVDIEEDGQIFISGSSIDNLNQAKKFIQDLVTDVEVGQIYEGRVTKTTNFGAFVEFLNSKEGLIHISKIDFKRIEKVEDVLTVGDTVKFKVIEIDSHGRINLSRKDCLVDNSDNQKNEQIND